MELTVTENNGANGSDAVAILVADSRLVNNLNSNNIDVYPKPGKGMVIIAINITQPDPNLLVMIRNANGRTIYKKSITSGETDVKQSINLSNLPNGPYAITVYFNNQERQTLKILKL